MELMNKKEKILLLKEIDGIKDGRLFPTSDPYTEKEDMARLQKGVDESLYTKKQLDYTLRKMRKSDTYCLLRTLYKNQVDIDHTRFASKSTELKDYGFHLFLGREVYGDGHEHFVKLEVVNVMLSLGIIKYDTLDAVLEHLFSDTKKGRKILLSESPGKLECSQDKSIGSRTYMPFSETQMLELYQRFIKNPEMEKFKNPFDYQPVNLKISFN